MARQQRKAVLFFDTAPGDRAAAAAIKFDAVAAKLGLPFTAVTRVLPLAEEKRPDSDVPAAVVAVNKAECEPLLPTLPSWIEVTDHWTIARAADAAEIESAVSKLVATLLGGRVVADEPTPVQPVKQPPKKVHTVRVGRETAGRRGKGVTTVFDLPLTEDQIKELATTLKQKCGTGGTAKDGRIEIQGDHRDRIVAELESLGYKVKRTGG